MKKHAFWILCATLGAAFLAFPSCIFRQLHTTSEPLEGKAAAPDFNLPDQAGNSVTLESLLEKGPAILVFYRGYW